MRNFLILLLFIPTLISCQTKISFIEQNREFTISTNGGFEYSILSGDYISRNYSGNPTKVGPVYISYNYSGRPTKIGSVYISYNYSGRPTKIGGLYISYDYSGRVTRTSGSVK